MKSIRPTEPHQKQREPVLGAVRESPGRSERRQCRLEQLLRRRERLACIAVERMSHDLPDSQDYVLEQLQLEQALHHCWPDVYEQLFDTWVLEDVSRVHTPDRPHPGCGICLASHSVGGRSDEPPWETAA